MSAINNNLLEAQFNEALSHARPNTAFENLYYNEHAYGSSLTFVLRTFDQFFDEQCVTDNDAYAVAMRVCHVALAIFVYPIFGLIALVGVGVNALHLAAHNQEMREWAELNLQTACHTPNEYHKESFLYPPDSHSQDTEKQTIRKGAKTMPPITLQQRYLSLKDWLPKKIDEATSKGRFVSLLKISSLNESLPLLEILTTMNGYPATEQMGLSNSEVRIKIITEAPKPQDEKRIAQQFAREHFRELKDLFE